MSGPAFATSGHAATTARHERLTGRVEELLALRTDANERFFAVAAEPLARLCHRVAERFSRGGRLLAIGRTPQARSDARHVAVEFVHPVIVGKRALPALALTGEEGALRERVALMADPRDVAIAFGRDGETAAALAVAAGRGCLTVAFEAIGAEWELEPPLADPLVRQELTETAYHLLWELVHVFFEHRGLLAGRDAGPVHDPGAASFLYPFLTESERDPERVLEDVRGSILQKAHEIGVLRAQTLREGADTLIAAATMLRERLDAGATVLALGNGGSATDAMDAVADLREPPRGWPARRAIDLTEDAAILTAIANDIGVEAVFRRQVIAHGREGGVLLALSTSGGSANVIDALAEARGRGLATIALVGYDGGRIAADGLADHVLVTRSQHIPRIQEAQASAWHVLRELVEDAA
ncbi:MAG: SIS domain-containing protein [Solirubrobacteraceae bacterium]